MHRGTVRQALDSAVPPPRKKRVFAAPALDPVKPLIDGMLGEDLDAPRKQRHTARRVLAPLADHKWHRPDCEPRGRDPRFATWAPVICQAAAPTSAISGPGEESQATLGQPSWCDVASLYTNRAVWTGRRREW